MCDIGTNYIKTIKATTLFVVFLFVHSWEQRKLGEVSESYSGGTPSVGIKEYYGGQIPFIRSAEINSETTELFLTEEGLKNSSARLVAVGDILYALYGATSGEVGRAMLKGAINQAILAIKPNKDYDSEYLAQWLRKSKHRIIETYLQGGQGNLSGAIVKELSADFPSLKEQKTIGDFFRQLDNLITLHQRKDFSHFSQILRRKKHSFLPISWEQRKLGDFATKVTEKNTQNTVRETFTNSAEFGVISQRDFFDHDISKADKIDGYYVVENDDFIYNPRISVTAPCGPINRNKLGRKGVMSPLYTVFRIDNIDVLFLEWFFKSSCWYAYMYFNGDSGARSDRFSIKNELFFDMPIPAPNIDEQKHIGMLMETLNNLITLHQRECFYIYKKYLLFLEMQNSHKRNYSWEQRKLGDITQIIMGQSPDGSTYSDFPTDYILVQGNADLENGWVKPRIWTTQKTKYAVAGDLIMSVRAPAGSMGKTAYNVVLGRGVAAIKGNEFIFQVLTKMDLEGFWKKLSAGSTFESLNSDNIINANINLPSNLEQDKIGSIFENIDNLITLHQCESCKKVAAVQSAFARRNLSKWADSWEQRKFEDFFTERNERSGNGEMISVTIGSGIKKFDELNRFDKKPDDLSKYKRVEVGDIAYNSMRMWQGASGYSPYSGILSPAYTVITPKNGVSSRFFAYVLKQPKIIHQFEINSQGLTKDTWNLKFPAFAPIEVVAPLQLAEQEKVSKLLLQLDNLITLHQCKVFYKNIIFKNIKFGDLGTENNTSWEQRKLGEAGTTFTGLSGKTKEDFGHGNAGFVTYMNVFSNPIADLTQYEKVELDSKQAQVKYGDVFFTTSSETPEEVGMSSIWLGKQPNIYLNSFCFGYRPSISTNPYYLGFMLRSASVRKKFILLAQGISRYNISKNKAMEIVVSIPSESEQENVGTFFKEIDNLITLHQRIKIFFTGDYHDKKNK